MLIDEKRIGVSSKSDATGLKVLLIMPRFFNYPEVIQSGIEDLGHRVTWFDDRPNNKALTKVLVRINRNIIKRSIERHFQAIEAEAERSDYDVVLVISGQSLSFGREQLMRLRGILPRARFILYQWDSVDNYQYVKQVLDCFDSTYTFDKEDSISYSMSFLPLFFHPGYQKLGREIIKREEAEFDVSFIGTAHPKKYEFVQCFTRETEGLFNKSFIYQFLPSRLVYIRHKLLADSYSSAKKSQFHFKALSPRETESVISRSWCVLDSPQDGQRGLTMRTLECLGAKRKLITTNPDIMNYDFYKAENIYVYQGSIDRSDPFFATEYVSLPSSCYEKYSLRHWLKTILSEEPLTELHKDQHQTKDEVLFK